MIMGDFVAGVLVGLVIAAFLFSLR